MGNEVADDAGEGRGSSRGQDRPWRGTWLLQAGLLRAHEQLLRVRGRDAASLAQSEAVSRPQRKHFLLQPVTGLFLEQERPNLNQRGLNQDRKVI